MENGGKADSKEEGVLSSSTWVENDRWPLLAKLVGEHCVFYMRKFSATLGRVTSSEQTADFLVSTDSVISRMHARISYSVVEQAFEIEALGKNGIYVNGRYITRHNRPAVLRSQVEIIMGSQRPIVMTFVLPSASTTEVNRRKHKQKLPTGEINIVDRVGEALSDGGEDGMKTVDEITSAIWNRIYQNPKNPYRTKTSLASGVRRVLQLNSYFMLDPVITPGVVRKWKVCPEHTKRFASSLSLSENDVGVTVMSNLSSFKRQKITT
mmetsp:Transcript_35732/g.142888  ORF Transcript_35732/g.142888 Transcript_35732/m.142888 type:complete len:266 (-) Transcript_35732:4709-5506(-)